MKAIQPDIPSSTTPPTAAEKPQEPIDAIRQLDRLIRQHAPAASSREQELVSMLGSVDVEAILMQRPELLTEKGDDILRIQSMMRMSQAALRGAKKRLMELAPMVINGLSAHERRIRDLHRANMEKVRARVATQLRAAGIPEDQLARIVERSNPVNEEFSFQVSHPCDPVRFQWEIGEGGVHVIRDPHAGSVITAYEQTMANLAATEAHTLELEQSLK